MNMIELFCYYCGKKFKREKRDHKRSLKLGRREFCSLSCTCKQKNKENPTKGNPHLLRSDNRKDEFSPFRTIARAAKKRKKEFNLDAIFLKDIWDKQNGICPYTGIKMTFEKGKPETVSLDRVNSKIGYIKGNVQFVCLSMNYAKNGFLDKEIKNFIKKIEYNKI